MVLVGRLVVTRLVVWLVARVVIRAWWTAARTLLAVDLVMV